MSKHHLKIDLDLNDFFPSCSKFAKTAKIAGTPMIFLGDGSTYNGPRDAVAIKASLK